ncbi:MAG: heme exporter protein CcmD [Thiotrichales bacterium]|jgi:heme exporter protein D|nr:heme exporter protein CcmD [Thiotrichales bacterium]MBT4552985.1 heme exporter protein CcmD [Candidatus Thioglobus sp.]MBT3854116.1 heme exporter protein CcmD [Thiotrichales bacterium]MBT5499119.1 heme exporter protein CcmD [Thiotrichales bacterium]MBT6771617.1 heme exporter protein CcmD [Thiotrichales bacterium]
MTMVEYFSFLPYGKYAFYVWLAYGISALTVITLFINAKRNHKRAILSLKNKFSINQ